MTSINSSKQSLSQVPKDEPSKDGKRASFIDNLADLQAESDKEIISDYDSDSVLEDGYDHMITDFESKMQQSFRSNMGEAMDYLKKKKDNIKKE
jgi:hypothetical protein